MKKTLVIIPFIILISCLLSSIALAGGNEVIEHTDYQILTVPINNEKYESQIEWRTSYNGCKRDEAITRIWTEKTNYGIKDKTVELTRCKTSGWKIQGSLGIDVKGEWVKKAIKVDAGIEIKITGEKFETGEDTERTTEEISPHDTVYVIEKNVTLTYSFTTKKVRQTREYGNEDEIWNEELLAEIPSSIVYSYTKVDEIPRHADCEPFDLDIEWHENSDGRYYKECKHQSCNEYVYKVKDCAHPSYSAGVCPYTSRCECGKYNPNLGHTPDMTTASRYPVLGMLYNCIGYPYGCNEVFPVKVDDGHNHHFMIGDVPYNGEPITDKNHQPICKICQATYHEVKGCTDFEPATCTTPPQCIICGMYNGEKLPHSWDGIITCTHDKMCNDCGATSGVGFGHDFKWVTTSATCTEDGKKEHKCARCGDVKGVKTIEKLGHDWNTTKTCTYDKKCNRCKTQSGVGLGHDYKWVTTSATCTKDGKKEHKCARCGDVKGVKTISKLGHDWNTTRTCTYDKKCNRCGTTTGTGIGHIYAGTANRCKFCGKPKNVDIQ